MSLRGSKKKKLFEKDKIQRRILATCQVRRQCLLDSSQLLELDLDMKAASIHQQDTHKSVIFVRI